MKDRRVDKIERILKNRDGRARLQEVLEALHADEGNSDIPYSSAYIAIQGENRRLVEEGERPKFVTSREGEERGWVRLQDDTEFALETEAGRLERRIREANEAIDEEIEEWLQNMKWEEFESTFLTQVLEKLGFQDVEITQRTRDGGVDARVIYQRGIVKAKALVSAKRWSSAGRAVGADEVHRLRGIGGDEDTAIIVTTGRFSASTLQDARPGQNQRAVYLIDGKQLAEVCKKHELGVKKVVLPTLFVLDPESTSESREGQTNGNDSKSLHVRTKDGDHLHVRRFRDEMLGDPDRGLSPEEIADICSCSINTVRQYLATSDKRRMLGQSIRSNEELRSRAIEVVSRKRAQNAYS